MRTNYVLVDFENIQPENMGLLVGGPFKVKVFLGEHQAKIPLEMARALQAFGADAEYIQIEGHGRNALDFHIAYYLGRIASEQPDAFIHVISKDTGFDPLIKHLKAKNIYSRRSVSIAEIPAVKTPTARPANSDKIVAIIDNLSKRKTGKPRMLKTLRSTIKALYPGQLGDEEIEVLIEQMAARQAITITNGNIAYASQS